MTRNLSAEIIVSGTEILLGDLVDTNSAWISQHLRDMGIDVYYHTTVGDNVGRLQSVIETALRRVNLVIITGGVGPTVDDVTREALAAAVGQPLVFRPELLQQIADRFARFGRPMAANNRRQAYIPAGAIAIPNPVGTAPAFRVEEDGGIVIALPGVPREMTYLMENAVLPYLRELVSTSAIVTRVLHAAGIGESQIDAVIGDLMTGSNPTVGLNAHPGQTDIRVTAKAATRQEALAMIVPIEAVVRERLSEYVYGADGERLAATVVALARRGNRRIALVETLTGGLIAQELLEAGPDVLISHSVEPSPDDLSEMAVRQRAEVLLAESGAEVALASLARQSALPDHDAISARQAALAAATAGRSDATVFGFGGHPGLFQPWIVNYSLYLLWKLLRQS